MQENNLSLFDLLLDESYPWETLADGHRIVEIETATQPVILVAEPLPLGRYLHAELLRCLHGDQRRELVKGLATISLTFLRIEARTVQ